MTPKEEGSTQPDLFSQPSEEKKDSLPEQPNLFSSDSFKESGGDLFPSQGFG